MDNNIFSDPSADTLDENIIRSEEVVPRFGWRWAISAAYLFFITGMTYFMLNYSAAGSLAFNKAPLIERVLNPRNTPVLVMAVFLLFFVFRRQVGWVGVTIIVAGMIVFSTIGFVVQFIPALEPVAVGRSGRLITSAVSAGVACFVFYLLSHPRLRAGFRIPQSWIRRCVTLGGLLGMGVGMWLIWLVTRHLNPLTY